MIFAAPAAASIVAPPPAIPSSFPFSFFSTPVLVETVTEIQLRGSSADSLSACCCDRLSNSVCAYQKQLGGVFLVPDESFLREEEDLGLRCDDDEEHKSQKTTTMVTKITATALTVITVQSLSPNTFVVRESSRTISLSIPISPVFTRGNKILQH
jgi:hypothetical protein